MKANKIYQQLEKDFINPKMSDDWAEYMDSVSDFLSENFKQRSMGLVCDFTKEINQVYTAVFPSNKVMKEILDDSAQNALLFVHHPSIWDIRRAPEVFLQMDRNLLQQFKDKNISIYNLHTPLDNYGKYSTSVTLAKALKIEPEKSFAYSSGALCGVFGKTKESNVHDLKEKFQKTLGHEVSLYDYGDDNINDNKVAIIAGGGNNIDMLKEIYKAKINTFITGITAKNDHSQDAHDFAKEHKINILGGTHYSTEKFACISMLDYFKNLGIPSKFIKDEPVLEDM